MVCSPLQADLARAQFKLPRIPSMRLPKIIPERIGTDELGLTSIQERFKAGLIPQSELQAAEDEIAVLMAEIEGNEVQVAQVRLAAAENQLARIKALFDTGQIADSEYQAARNSLELRQAELRAVQAKRSAIPATHLTNQTHFGRE
jgi:outer membrane protein TolC